MAAAEREKPTPPRVVPELLDDADARLLHGAMWTEFKARRNVVWPQAKSSTNVEFVLVPLDRIGAAPGFSGSKVLIAYFADVRRKLSSSHPFVVKIGDAKKLREEFNNGTNWAPLDPRHGNRFARPTGSPYIRSRRGVLLAPFSSNVTQRRGTTRYDIRVEDLWRRLVDADHGKPPKDWSWACGCVQRLVRLIGIAHLGGKLKQQRRTFAYFDEYHWYLRGAYEPDTRAHDNKRLVRRLFGARKTTRAFNRDWPNPIRVIRRLMSERPRFEGASGYIHGDLHPRNVVFVDDDPYVIDFGWAQQNRHIMKDLVMLDVNVRAMNAPAHTPPEDVVSLATFMSLSQPADDVGASLRPRAQMIKDEIWAAAEPNCRDWLREYVTPLFLVAYGLLVHLDKARNQAALAATVLAAGELINGSLDEKSS